MALLMALWALALVAILLPGLLAAGRLQLQGARLAEGDRFARAAALGAEQLAVIGLTHGAARTQPWYWQAVRGEVLVYHLEGAEVRMQLRDLNTCFNLNALSGPDAGQALGQLVYLLEHRPGGFDEPQVSPQAFSQRIADWVDDDGERREQGMETADALRLQPPAMVADRPMLDVSELDLVPPRQPGRFWRYPELCALPDSGGWRLNANALMPRDLPLLDALFTGKIPRDRLERLIQNRPRSGYADQQALRAALGDSFSEEDFALLTQNLVLNGAHYLLGIEVRRDGQLYRHVRQLQAEGVSRWAAAVPAQRVRVLARRQATLWEPGGDGAMGLY